MADTQTVTSAVVDWPGVDPPTFYFGSEDGIHFYEVSVEITAENVDEFLALREASEASTTKPMSFHRTFLGTGIGNSVEFTEIRVR
jgi:hypothetical protein